MRQKLGQHFLKNPSVAAAIAAALEVAARETIVEIGPGHGELTQAIIAARGAAAASGGGGNGTGKLVLIERDTELAAELRERFKEEKGLELIEGDVLKQLAPAVAALPPGPYAIAGNLPYYVTGHLLRVLSELERKPERAVFMVQTEVAERMIAEPPQMNRLAAAVQFWAEPKIVRQVKRGEFDPPPEVDSAVILLTTRPGIAAKDGAKFYEALRMLFAQPRKTVFNNLRDGLSPKGDPDAAERAKRALEEAGVDPGARPQDLTLENVERIGQAVEEIR